MAKKKDIWSQVITHLESRLPKSDFRTWFSRAALQKLDSDLAILSVPNKFVANWLSDNYLTEIKKSFKAVVNKSLSIHFSYDHPTPRESALDSHVTENIHSPLKHRLNPSMTFDHFIVGEYNRFACSSALEVAETTSDQYNPLYIYSDQGLGKTHLLHAIGNHRLRKHPTAKISYLSSDTFSSDFIYAIKYDKVDEFRAEYCSLDVLLVDDIHLLANREKTQEEFLFVFDSLQGSEKQVVITGHSAPKQLKNLNPHLKSRLGCGLLVDIRFPDQETKIEIVKKKAEDDNIHIPEDVIFFLANSNTDVKSLVKNLVRLETHSSLNSGNINISLLKTLMRDKDKSEIDLEDVKTTTAGYFNISLADLISDKKKRIYSYPRQLAMYLIRKNTPLSYKEIGAQFGQKDHSTVVHAIKRIEGSKDRNKKIMDDIKKIENLLS